MRAWLPRLTVLLYALPLAACTPIIALIVGVSRGSSEGGTITFGQSVSGSTSSTSDNFDPGCSGNSNANDQTWSFVAPETLVYTVAVTSDWDNLVYVLDGGNELGCNDDSNGRNARVDVQLTAGQQYTIVVDGYGDASGSYTLDITRSGDQTPRPPPVPGTDGGVAALPEQEPGALTAGVRVHGSTSNGADHATPSCGARAGSPDDEWTFVPATTEVYRVRTFGEYDTIVAVLDARRTELACNDDSLGTRDAMVEVQMQAGQRYSIVVDGYGGQLGGYDLLIESASGTPTPTRVGIGGVLTLGQRIVGSTLAAPDTTVPVCGGASDGTGDNTWTFTTRQRGLHRIRVDGNFATVLELRDGDRAISCVDSGAASRPAEIVAMLEAAHEYRVIIDGHPGQEGTFRLNVDDRVPAGTRVTPTLPTVPPIGPPPPAATEDAAAMTRACAAALPLGAGRTRGAIDPANGAAIVSCARRIAAGDVVYRIDVTRRSHVRVRETSDFDAVLELRRACTGAAAVACVDDAPDTRRTAVEADLDPGSYFLVVDTVSPGTGGAFTLDVEIR